MVIEVKDIYKRFGKLQVLKGLNFSFDKGTIYSILGPNGSGKTTLMKSMLGLVHPNSGEIIYQGKNIINNHSYRKRIGYVPQIANFPENLTVIEVIRLVENVRQVKGNYSPFIERFALESFLSKKLKTLSGGTRQKVNLTLALMFDFDILIMDEPTSGLDPINRIHLKEYIKKLKEQGKTIIFTTHILSLAETLADEIIFLQEGLVRYHGSPTLVKEETKTDSLEEAIATLLSNSISEKENMSNSNMIVNV